MQVAKCALFVHVGTLVNAWLVEQKHLQCKLQGRWQHGYKSCVHISKFASWYIQDKHHQHKLQLMPTASASEVFALNNDRKKHYQRKLQRVKTILGTSSSRMQQTITTCTRAEALTRPCPCATCIWLLHPAPTLPLAQDGLDSLQLVLVVSIEYIYIIHVNSFILADIIAPYYANRSYTVL